MMIRARSRLNADRCYTQRVQLLDSFLGNTNLEVLRCRGRATLNRPRVESGWRLFLIPGAADDFAMVPVKY